MASIATPESDDDDDYYYGGWIGSSPMSAAATADGDDARNGFETNCYGSYSINGNGNGQISSYRESTKFAATSIASDTGYDQQGCLFSHPERAYAVVATPNAFHCAADNVHFGENDSFNPTMAQRCLQYDFDNSSVAGGNRNSIGIGEMNSLVVMESGSPFSTIARPANGPQLFRAASAADPSAASIYGPATAQQEMTAFHNFNHHLPPTHLSAASETVDVNVPQCQNSVMHSLESFIYRPISDRIVENDEDVSIENRRPALTAFQMNALPPPPSTSKHFVVVAIDFGTALSGYAFSFVRDPSGAVHMMRRWDGGDPGVVNQKTPTVLLLDPEGRFHSFGYAARDFYHDLDDDEARTWMYFDRFKMTLHHDPNLNCETMLTAVNGRRHPALNVFAHALRYFRDHAMNELADQSSTSIVDDDVRWVITVPAIWRPAAKQFMRQAAIMAKMTTPETPERLLIALEPEAAAIYVRKLHLYQLVPDSPVMEPLNPQHRERSINRSARNINYVCDENLSRNRLSRSFSRDLVLDDDMDVVPMSNYRTVEDEANEISGSRGIVVDCGGGTVDITVHEADPQNVNRFREVYKASGGPHGSIGVDMEFERLLVKIFGLEFIEAYKRKRPSGWVDLMVAFESRKRSANPGKDHPLNICLPFSFIDYHKKHRGCQVEVAVRKYADNDIRWSSQGMLRLTLEAMKRLFEPTVQQIKLAIADVVGRVRDVHYLFLVGGFAESPILQQEIRSAFGEKLKIFVPQDVALTVLKGAVQFGLDPAVITRRRSMLTYGVEVLHKFDPQRHPSSKRIRRGGVDWCKGIFDIFVRADQDVDLGQTIIRSYAPPSADQKTTIINIYSSERPDVEFVTDPDVNRCGQLRLDLDPAENLPPMMSDDVVPINEDDCSGDDVIRHRKPRPKRRRQIQTLMTFGDTEVGISALDIVTGNCVRASVDFLGHI